MLHGRGGIVVRVEGGVGAASGRGCGASPESELPTAATVGGDGSRLGDVK
jgi:hypothetical protein